MRHSPSVEPGDPGRFRPGPGPIVLISDSHLGSPEGPPERTAWFVEFLESLPGRIGGLLVVGDLFDFWFEYRHAVPKGHFAVCRALAEITRLGVPTLYFGGNHDFWAGTYLRDEIGLQVTEGPISLEVQGLRLFVAHGDGLGSGDTGYKILKKILRNRVSIALYRCVHPDIGIPLAHRVSSISRRHGEAREVILPRLAREVASRKLAEDHDAVVIGHIHEPAHLRLEAGEFLVIGDWLRNFTYVVLRDGRFSLRRHRSGGDIETDEEIPPEDQRL